MKILETERLELWEITEKDAPFILELFNTPSWIKFIGDRGLRSEKDAQDYINDRLRAAYESLGFGFYLTKKKEGDLSIGICGLVKREGLEYVDIGFAFLPQFEGQGFGFESASAVMDYAQHTLKISSIAGITVPENKNSIALLEKLGLRFEKMVQLPNDTEEIMLFVKQLNFICNYK